MRLRHWFSPPRHVLLIFLGVALVSTVALLFLVWLLLDQEKGMVVQRRQERLEQATDLTVSAMQRAMADLRRRFYREADLLEFFAVIYVKDDLIAVKPVTGLAYYPEEPGSFAPMAARLAEIERLPFSVPDKTRAFTLLEESSRDSDKEIQAVALNAMAQIHRKAGKFAEALKDYERLGQLEAVRVDGLPAGLLARVGKAGVFEENRDTASLHSEAAALWEDVNRARWRLVKSEFEFYSALARGWMDAAAKYPPRFADNMAFAEVFAGLWKEKPWEDPSPGFGDVPVLRLIRSEDAPVLAMWTDLGQGYRIALAGKETLSSLCRDTVADPSLQCTLTDSEGKTLLGGVPSSHQSATLRTSAMTGLPWGLQISVSPQSPFLLQATMQRGLLLWLVVVLAMVWGFGTWFIMRAIARELRVARLQSDFVAAVSHEFRSPLSAVGQVSEMLATDRFESEDVRRKAYSVLTRESQRLRDLVESLLDFGRLESGRDLYHFEPLEVGEFLTRLIAAFQERVPDHTIEWKKPDNEFLVRADREALSRAVNNLLDNAVKYSPDSDTVWVEVVRKDGRVEISVRDRGLGIPAREQDEVFERFVRGSNVKDRQIKGTGVGLAMVRHIMKAHGGEVLLSSEPGEGSRFTLKLPEALTER